MDHFVVQLVVATVLLLLIAKLVRGIEVDGAVDALVAAIVLGVVNAVVRPLMIFLTLPLTIMTFGLFLLVINALMLRLTAAVVPGFRVEGFGPALLGSVLLTVFNLLAASLLGPS